MIGSNDHTFILMLFLSILRFVLLQIVITSSVRALVLLVVGLIIFIIAAGLLNITIIISPEDLNVEGQLCEWTASRRLKAVLRLDVSLLIEALIELFLNRLKLTAFFIVILQQFSRNVRNLEKVQVVIRLCGRGLP